MLCLVAELCCGGVLWETLYLVAALPNFCGKHIISGSVLLHNTSGLAGKPPRGGREGTKGRTNRNIWDKFALIVPRVRTCSDVWISIEMRKVPAKRAWGLESTPCRETEAAGTRIACASGLFHTDCGIFSTEQLCSLQAPSLQLCTGAAS